MVDRVSTGNEQVPPNGGKGLNKATDTEKFELCSGTEVNCWRIVKKGTRLVCQVRLEDLESQAEKCILNVDGSVSCQTYLNWGQCDQSVPWKNQSGGGYSILKWD